MPLIIQPDSLPRKGDVTADTRAIVRAICFAATPANAPSAERIEAAKAIEAWVYGEARVVQTPEEKRRYFEKLRAYFRGRREGAVRAPA